MAGRVSYPSAGSATTPEPEPSATDAEQVARAINDAVEEAFTLDRIEHVDELMRAGHTRADGAVDPTHRWATQSTGVAVCAARMYGPAPSE